ncbi:MAG TPA: DNA photolyase [Spirochaetia bacterium]|nr:DNA photolyase [Spirochaetia bacterium]
MTPGTVFSRVYVESGAREYPICREILARLRTLPVTEISNYHEVFSRPRQSFAAQKRMPALILAVKSGTFLYRGGDRINSWQRDSVHYNDLVRNCVYDCEYCFLQGMHPSANAVVFVNVDDYFAATQQALEEAGSLFLSISYLTDLLGFEPIVPYTRKWIDFARSRSRLQLEIRTKSDNYPALRGIEAAQNIVFVWSIAPAGVAAAIERGTASFPNRLFAARSAIQAGFRVRLCFDPVILRAGWEEEYRTAVRETFRRLPAERIEFVSVGGLRMGVDQFSKFRKDNPSRARLFTPYRSVDRMVSYSATAEARVVEVMGEAIGKFLPDERIKFLTSTQPGREAAGPADRSPTGRRDVFRRLPQ